MESLTPAALTPGVQAFLDALDRALNAQTLLFAVALDAPALDEEAVKQAFADWFNSSLFQEMLEEVLRLRGWNRGDIATVRAHRTPSSMHSLTPREYKSQLWYLLQDAPNPPDTRPTPGQAEQALASFLSEYFGLVFPVSYATYPPWYDLSDFAPPQTLFFWVSPLSLSLRLEHYFVNPALSLADSVTLWCQGDTMGCLMTNGSS